MKKRLAIFHLGFFYAGGGEKLVLEEARELSRQGWAVTVLAPVVDREESFPELMAGVKMKRLMWPLPKWLPFRDGLAIIGACVSFPFQLWRVRKFDYFLGANQPGVYFAWLAGRFWRRPYAAYLAQPNRLLYQRRIDLEQQIRIKEDYRWLMGLKKGFGFLIARLDRQSIEGARAVLVNGKFAAEELKKVYRIEPVICPAGAHLGGKIATSNSRYHSRLVIAKRKIEGPYLLLTNRHYPQKKFEYVISALPFLLDGKVPVRLVITGAATNYTTFLKTLVRQLGLEKRVIFTGLVTEKELERLYRGAWVYVYPSPEEDFGMGVVEAMAAGVPVVAWDWGGPARVVENGRTGFLARPYEVKDLAAKIKKIWLGKELNGRLGRAGRRRVRQRYTYTVHCRQLRRELEKLDKGEG